MAVGMAMALLLLPFLPASGILLQVGFVIAERYIIGPLPAGYGYIVRLRVL